MRALTERNDLAPNKRATFTRLAKKHRFLNAGRSLPDVSHLPATTPLAVVAFLCVSSFT